MRQNALTRPALRRASRSGPLVAIGLFLIAPDLAAQMEHIVIQRDETMYTIIPWITRLKSGDLIVSAREAHRRRPDQRGHVDPTARGILIRSRDGGRTWGEKTVSDNETYRLSQTEDVPLVQLADGTLLLNLYSWAISPLPVGFPLRTIRLPNGTIRSEKSYAFTFEGSSLIRSSDGGRTWSNRQPINVDGLPRFAARSPAVELPDGMLLLAVYGRAWADETSVYSAWTIRSTDKGKSWENPSLMAQDPEGVMAFAETGMLRRHDGELIALHRTADGGGALKGFLFQTNSSDGGRTWTKPAATKMWGWPAHMLELRDGRILCTYGYRRPPYGVRACISRDGGKSWDIDKEIVLRDDGGSHDLGYPSSVALDDGRVLTVYWFNGEKPGDVASEVRYIAGTFYRP